MISIIVPVYNVEKYLEACLDSILNSSFTDFELILVDDGSTDRSGAICDAYQDKDHRIAVIHQVNAGVSAARNAGLRVSSGEYITFVDSDDLVHPLMLEILMFAISSGDYDMSVVLNEQISFEERSDYMARPIEQLGKMEPVIMSQLEYTSLIFLGDYRQNLGPCHKLFKRSLIFRPQKSFVEYRSIPAEDVEWLTRIYLRLNQMIKIPLKLYFYINRNDSLTHRLNERGINDTVVGSITTHYQCYKLIPNEFPQWKAASLVCLFHVLRLYDLWAHGTSYADEVRSLYRTYYRSTIKDFLRAPLSPMTKMKYVFCYHFPGLYRSFINLVEWVAKLRH